MKVPSMQVTGLRWQLRPWAVCLLTGQAAAATTYLSSLHTDHSVESHALVFHISFALVVSLVVATWYTGAGIGRFGGFIIAIAAGSVIGIPAFILEMQARPPVWSNITIPSIMLGVGLTLWLLQRLSSLLTAAVSAIAWPVALVWLCFQVAPELPSIMGVPLVFIGLFGGLMVTAAPERTQLSIWRKQPIKARFAAWKIEYPGPIQQVISEKGLDEEFVPLVRRVAKRTRLSTSEKERVTSELCDHFSDGIAAGHSPERLIQEFGEPETAAKLIRRAKLRCRGINHKVFTIVWKTTLCALSIVTATYLVQGVRVWTAKPKITVDYIAKVNQAIDEYGNGPAAASEWFALWATVPDRLDGHEIKVQADGRTHILPDHTMTGRQAESLGILHEWRDSINQHSVWIAKARELGLRQDRFGLPVGTAETDFPQTFIEYQKNRGWDIKERDTPASPKMIDPLKNSLPEVLLPAIHPQSQTAQVLAHDANLAAYEGDTERFMQNLCAGFSISEDAREHPFLINEIVAQSLYRFFGVVIKGAISDDHMLLNINQLRELAHMLSPTEVNLKRSMRSEHWNDRELLQRLYTDDGNGDGILTQEAFTWIMHKYAGYDPITRSGSWGEIDIDTNDRLLSPVAISMLATRKEALANMRRYRDIMTEQLSLPPWQRNSDVMQDWADSITEQYNRFLDIHHDPLNAMVTWYGGTETLWRYARYNTNLDGTLIAIALCSYNLEHGAWPSTLDELVPHHLPSVPLDPYDGKQLRYVLGEDGPVVYSIGYDRDDDGGHWPTAGQDPQHEASRPPHTQPLINDKNDGDWVLFRLGGIEREPLPDVIE